MKTETARAAPLGRLLTGPVPLFLVFFAGLVALLFVKLAVSGYIIGSDGLGYYAHLRSIFIDGDFQYANEFLDFNPFGHGVPDPYRLTGNGHVPNPYSVGPAILWAPFFLVAHALTLASGLLGLGLEADGYSTLYQVFVGLGSVVYGAAGLALIYRILRRFFQQGEATLATALIALGTNVLYYLAIEPVMSHAMSMFLVSLFAYVWLKSINCRTRRDVVVLGLTAGLMIMVRPQNLLFLSLIGLEWIGLFSTEKTLMAHWRRNIAEAATFGVVLLVALLPQLAIWKILYGQVIVDSYEGASFAFTNPFILESLFSARHGLISWTPLLLPALAGVLLFTRDRPALGIALLVAFLLQLYINASWADYWWFGESFGSRAYINCSFIFAIGLAQFITSTRRLKAFIFPLFAALVLWNLLFIVQFSTGMVSRSEAVDFRQVLSNQIAIPGKLLRIIDEHL